jgi:hypothetical protein
MARYVLGLPAPALAGYAFKPVMILYGRWISKAGDAEVREDLARLPGLLDHADELIDAGVIGGVAPNAADLQILTSVGPAIAGARGPATSDRGTPMRPGGSAADPGLPELGSNALPPIPAVLPSAWLPAPCADQDPRPTAAPAIKSKQPA